MTSNVEMLLARAALSGERGDLGVKTGKGVYDYAGDRPDDIIRRHDNRLMFLLDAYWKGMDA